LPPIDSVELLAILPVAPAVLRGVPPSTLMLTPVERRTQRMVCQTLSQTLFLEPTPTRPRDPLKVQWTWPLVMSIFHMPPLVVACPFCTMFWSPAPVRSLIVTTKAAFPGLRRELDTLTSRSGCFPAMFLDDQR
jgi:hypothetical protein